MEDIYEEMIAASKEIAASFPQPQFYVSCREPLNLSHSLFEKNPQVTKCRAIVLRELKDDLGHGMDHARKVALEAGVRPTRLIDESKSMSGGE
jgi:hypothetical protein